MVHTYTVLVKTGSYGALPCPFEKHPTNEHRTLEFPAWFGTLQAQPSNPTPPLSAAVCGGNQVALITASWAEDGRLLCAISAAKVCEEPEGANLIDFRPLTLSQLQHVNLGQQLVPTSRPVQDLIALEINDEPHILNHINYTISHTNFKTILNHTVLTSLSHP